MPRKKITGAVNSLNEKFAPAWKLLSDTTMFLSNMKLLEFHERQLREWRHMLQTQGNNLEVVRTIQKELISLRKGLRKEGYDISLGSYDLKFEGFRNDACVREGFKRMVMAITDGDVLFTSGQANHVELYMYLEKDLVRRAAGRIRQQHFLWYQWRGRLLVLSGSDTESQEAFQRLMEFAEQDKFFLLKRLKRLP